MKCRRHDFLETPGGLLFAVVVSGAEQGRAICFLRYLRKQKNWQKIGTAQANAYLLSQRPEYHFHSPLRDAAVHGVPLPDVTRRLQPAERAVELAKATDAGTTGILRVAKRLLLMMSQLHVPLRHVGVTGSLLVGAQTEKSDIDLVIYGRRPFQQAQASIEAGKRKSIFYDLTPQQWKEAYARRGSALSLEEYVWHEQRKQNKAIFAGVKFDISQGDEGDCADRHLLPTQKVGQKSIECRITDDAQAFAFPACWQIDHPQISQLASYTPTYTGQARTGERVQACGVLEEMLDGRLRLVVGGSREASGEWIRVVEAIPS